VILMALYWQLPASLGVELVQREIISRELDARKEKRKKLKRKVNYVPPKIKRAQIHQQYRNSKSRDARYSNQQKLRRMYRNS
jgi:hypothetical protein